MAFRSVFERLAILTALTPLVGGGRVCAAEAKSPEKLSFAQLERLGLLNENELWAARNLRNREPQGITVDLQGDGRRETVVAGVRSELVPSPSLEQLRGALKVYGKDSADLLWEQDANHTAGPASSRPRLKHLQHIMDLEAGEG